MKQSIVDNVAKERIESIAINPFAKWFLNEDGTRTRVVDREVDTVGLTDYTGCILRNVIFDIHLIKLELIKPGVNKSIGVYIRIDYPRRIVYKGADSMEVFNQLNQCIGMQLTKGIARTHFGKPQGVYQTELSIVDWQFKTRNAAEVQTKNLLIMF